MNNCWLGDELAALTRQAVRDFTRQEVEPLAERMHRHDELAPDDLIAKMGQLGFFAMSIPETYGGTGMGYVVMIITTEELSRGSLGAAGSLITRPEIVARALLEGGTEAQRRRWLPRIASGELMVAVSVTEPDIGSDVAAITCRATLVSSLASRGILSMVPKPGVPLLGEATLLACSPARILTSVGSARGVIVSRRERALLRARLCPAPAPWWSDARHSRCDVRLSWYALLYDAL